MVAIEKDRMPLLGHLQELRKRVLVSFLSVCVGGVVCWFFYDTILELLLEPYCQIRDDSAPERIFGSGCELLVTDPLEPFGVRLTIAGYGGVILSIPMLLWQAWRFIAPGLLAKEKKWAIPFVFSGLILFLSGSLLAYWSIPRALDFLVEIGGPDLVSVFSPAKYIGFVIKMIVAFGIGFEFPLFLIFLQLLGVLTPTALRKSRRYAIVGIVALVAVLTPSGDPFTLLILSVPMILFYEIAIFVGSIRIRRMTTKA
ncbi:MAG: twin-arginine translocase subunit TatC [Acidimicrobiales bacterium]|nr:twin-arginine translocase subunit TatC [Acidimicrobiales bacterium]